MGRIVVTEFVSVDGVVEDPGGAEGFKHAGWSFEFSRGEEGDQFKVDETMNSAALLLGRVTYEGFADAWPSREGEFADKFNEMPKYLVSSTLERPEWNNTTVIGVDDIARMKEEQDGVVLVNGSNRLVDALAGGGLVEEYRLMVFPVVLGAGKRLFADPGSTTALELVEAKPVGPDGVVVLTYRRK